MNDIRQSVHTLQDGSDILSLIPSMQSLIKDTEKHAGVRIKFEIDQFLSISQTQGRALFRALQEGLTNGIRHGGSTSFDFSLKKVNNNIVFCLSDNGCGCDEISLGFGLTAMKERIIELGGIFDINTLRGKGFCLNISIPVEEEEAS